MSLFNGTILIDLSTVQGINVAEAKLEEKRMALRRALKREYLRQAFDPQAYPSGRRVFDTAMYRFAALQNSSANYVVQNARNFFMYLGVFWVPVGIVSVYYYNRRVSTN